MAEESKLQPSGMNESISALVDGEVSEMELHRILKASESDDSVRQAWGRYQLIAAVMRNDAPTAPSIDLSGAIRDALQSEDPVVVESEVKKPGWLQTVSKLAIAASVAAVMVVTTQMVGLNGNNGAQQPEVAADQGDTPVRGSADLLTPNPALPAGFRAPSLSARTVSSHPPRLPVQEAQPHYYPVVTKAQSAVSAQAPSPEVQEYLQRVMEIHADHASLNSSHGMMPYARVPAERE